MTDLLGPAAFGAARATTTRPVLTPGNAGGDPDTWVKDCSDPLSNDGTENRAGLFNMLLAQLRKTIRSSAVVQDNTDDAMLARAIRSQWLNYIAAVGGTANALTVTLDPVPTSLTALLGTPLRVKIAASNTAAATLNVNSLGAVAISRPDGTPIQAGTLVAGAIVELAFDGTNFQVIAIQMNATPVGNTVIITTSQTYIVPAGVYALRNVRIQGGGGGGGGASNSAAAGAGGGAGGCYIIPFQRVLPGQSIACTIGAGGSAGVGGGSPTPGGAGGSTSFGSFGGATAGTGGGQSTSGASGVNGAAGTGSGSAPGYSPLSGPSSLGYPVGGSSYLGGLGGAAYLCSLNPPNVGSAGVSSTAPGNGGNGSSNNAAGGAGGAGIITFDI